MKFRGFMVKVATIIGTRPEIIRLSRIVPLLDSLCNHYLIHTGQNYDHYLNGLFFKELGIRNPDVVIDSKSQTLSEQLSKMFCGVERALKEIKPDKVLILGDTNTSLCAVICERLGFPVYHMEAGNRCFDLNVPEEKNRRIIDIVSSYNLPYTSGSRENLIQIGIPKNKIFQTGNPIYEVLKYYNRNILESNIMDKHIISSGDFVLATFHREENVDIKQNLKSILEALVKISESVKVIVSCHPRTRKRIEEFGFSSYNENISILDPIGFFDFVKLEKEAMCVISDSGTVQEECCILGTPMVTIRKSTERPETLECGANVISGLERDKIIDCFNIAVKNKGWNLPEGYSCNRVSEKVCNFILGV